MIDDLDNKDSKQKRLAGFAGRIVKLLDKPDVQKNEPLVSVLDDLLGAIYALVAALLADADSPQPLSWNQAIDSPGVYQELTLEALLTGQRREPDRDVRETHDV